MYMYLYFFTRQFQEFFFSHFNLISSSLEQLRERVEETLWGRRQALTEIVMKAYESFVDSFKSLYCAQRIKVNHTINIMYTDMYVHTIYVCNQGYISTCTYT